MTTPALIAKHLRDVHFGGNWTASNLKDQLSGITWQQANRKVHQFNTILALTYHVHYYVHAILQVLKGNPLQAHDKYSFDHPAINSREDWEALLTRVWDEAEQLAAFVEKFPESQLGEYVADKKYGTWYRNLQGTIEHTHYHLGQIALIRKLVAEAPAA